MPIYEYVCRQCGHEFEWLTRDGEKPVCPSCSEESLDRKLSLPVAHTTGSSGPECPVKEAGACGMSNCCGNDCGLGQWS